MNAGPEGSTVTTSAPARGSEDVLAAARGTGFLAGGSFFEFAGRFGIALLLARSLGPSDYGLYVLAVSAGALFAGISQLGLDDAMVRYVAIQSGRGDRAGLRGTVQLGLGVAFTIGLVMGGILLVFSGPIAEGLFHEPALAPSLRLIAVLVPLLTISNVLAGTARGLGRMHHVAFAENVVMSSVRLVLLVIVVMLGELNLFLAVAMFGLSDVAASVTLIVLVGREVPIGTVFGGTVRRDTAAIMSFAIPLWLSGVLRQFRRNVETLLLGALAAASSVGIFAVVARVNLVAHVFLLSTLVAVKPILARLHDQRNHGGLQHIYRTATRWSLTLTLPFFLMMVLYPRPILAVFGEAFGAGAIALVIMSFAELINAATGICGPMIDMTGHTRVKLANSVLWTALVIATSAFLIPRFGVVGAATSMLIAIGSVNILCVIEVWVLERLVPFDRTFWKPAAAAAAALLCGVLLRQAVPVGDFVGAAVQGLVVGVVYVAILVGLGLPAEDRSVLERIRRRARSLRHRRSTLATAAVEKT